MVGLGTLMMLAGVISLFLRWRKKLYDAYLFHRFAILMGPTGFIAVLAGWITTEVGRQPFTIYGVLRTSESVAPVEAPAVAASLTAFIIVYFTLFGAGTYYILKMMNKNPGELAKLPGTVTRSAGITPAASLNPDTMAPDAIETET